VEKSSLQFLILIFTIFTPFELFACGDIILSEFQSRYFVALGFTFLAIVITIQKSGIFGDGSSTGLKQVKFVRNSSIIFIVAILLYGINGLVFSTICLSSQERIYYDNVIGSSLTIVFFASVLGIIYSTIMIKKISTIQKTMIKLIWVPVLISLVAITWALLMLTIFRPSFSERYVPGYVPISTPSFDSASQTPPSV